mgnify:CR=1 FL=1
MPVNALTVIGSLIGAGITYAGWRQWKKKQLIENTPRSTVRSISMGRTELHGTIDTDNPLEGPLSGKPVVAYEYKIQRENDDDDDPGRYDTLRSGYDTTTATLTDDTGTVAVDLDEVSIEQGTFFKETTHSFDDPSPELKEQLDKLNVSYEGWFGGNYDMKFTETRIETGDDVYLLGTARDNPDVADGTATKGHQDVLIEDAGNTYLIATGDEDNLVTTETYYAYGFLTVGLIILTLSLVYMIAY